MAEKKKTDTREKVILSALDLAAEKGWEDVTFADIADQAGLSLADLYDLYECKSEILAGFGRMIDKKTLADHAAPATETSPRDLIFDLLMDRYEALNEHRAGVIAILESFKYDPKHILFGLPHLCRSMTWILEACGVSTYGIKGAIRVTGLTGIYLKNAHVWMRDESADLAKVMAGLDQDLAKVESWARTLNI